jgi:hypothetical protein
VHARLLGLHLGDRVALTGKGNGAFLAKVQLLLLDNCEEKCIFLGMILTGISHLRLRGLASALMRCPFSGFAEKGSGGSHFAIGSLRVVVLAVDVLHALNGYYNTCRNIKSYIYGMIRGGIK